MVMSKIFCKFAFFYFLMVFDSYAFAERSSALGADQAQVILDGALKMIREDYTENLAFIERVTRGDNTVVGDYDPGREESPWILLSLDGAAPEAKDRDKYVKDKIKQTENLKKFPERSPLGVKTMVEVGSLHLIEEQPERWLFAFTPTGEDQKMMRKMKGKLSINKTGNYLEWMDVRSEKPFKVNLVTKMKEFLMHYEFQPFAGGQVVPTSFEFRIHIAVGGIDVADERLFANYSGYKLAN